MKRDRVLRICSGLNIDADAGPFSARGVDRGRAEAVTQTRVQGRFDAGPEGVPAGAEWKSLRGRLSCLRHVSGHERGLEGALG